MFAWHCNSNLNWSDILIVEISIVKFTVVNRKYHLTIYGTFCSRVFFADFSGWIGPGDELNGRRGPRGARRRGRSVQHADRGPRGQWDGSLGPWDQVLLLQAEKEARQEDFSTPDGHQQRHRIRRPVFQMRGGGKFSSPHRLQDIFRSLFLAFCRAKERDVFCFAAAAKNLWKKKGKGKGRKRAALVFIPCFWICHLHIYIYCITPHSRPTRAAWLWRFVFGASVKHACVVRFQFKTWKWTDSVSWKKGVMALIWIVSLCRWEIWSVCVELELEFTVRW